MSALYDETLCLCALNKIFGYCPSTGQALVNVIGSASGVFELNSSELGQILASHPNYLAQINKQLLDDTSEELENIQKKGLTFIGNNDENFPDLLRECNDCPLGLYIRSHDQPENIFREVPYIAVVGTRDLSSYGQEWCRRIVGALASCNEKPVIVSGLALGTDIIAHMTALECGLPTIAVLPTGIDNIYPGRHRSQASKIISTPHSALITDYPPGTLPMAHTFLRRNRIIAGLSRSIILTESKTKGGGLLTCELGFSYGRDIFALPGRADDLKSQGCNLLIKREIAEPIFDENSLLKSLGLSGQFKPKEIRIGDNYKGKLSDEEINKAAKIILEIKRGKGISIDELCRKLNMNYSETASLTAMLEADGFIICDLFQRYIINVNRKC